MAYHTIKEEQEREAQIADLNRLIIKLMVDAASALAEVDELRVKLAEAQERNRKLDWLLTAKTEGIDV